MKCIVIPWVVFLLCIPLGKLVTLQTWFENMMSRNKSGCAQFILLARKHKSGWITIHPHQSAMAVRKQQHQQRRWLSGRTTEVVHLFISHWTKVQTIVTEMLMNKKERTWLEFCFIIVQELTCLVTTVTCHTVWPSQTVTAQESSHLSTCC